MYDWLPDDIVLDWLKVPFGSPKADLVLVCRNGAASWIEDQRPDVDFAGEVPDRIATAGLLATARLFARIDSPNGVVAFDELGAGSILSRDPDIARQLGRAKWVVG